MGKASRRQRGTDTAPRQSRPRPAPFERRPFEGLTGETDWVALREILPAATAVVTVRPEHVPDGAPSEVTVATVLPMAWPDRKSTRLNSSHVEISYAVFCLKKKKKRPVKHT